MKRRLATVLLLVAAFTGGVRGEVRSMLVHPAAESEVDVRGAYPLTVLRAALERSGHPGTLVPYPVSATQERVLRLIEQGEMHVGWSMASADRERRLAMVPFPVDRGLLGWRLLLARRNELGRFAGLEDLEGLAAFRVAQGHDWPDLVILADNGLPTTSTVGYESLFATLELRRVDYLARAASEAERERRLHADLDLAVVPEVVLHYRTALVFYVRKGDEPLRDAIASGLEAMLADGSLQRLFLAAYGEDIAVLSQPSRRRIPLRNPIAAKGLEQAPAAAWWTP